ncbi:endonuclease 8 [Salmonella enterica subsp. enterica serovar Choleraesuis]|nr:endonuclease 8 [Salmonella enterica subsp. enterica serovar Choleraesuis]
MPEGPEIRRAADSLEAAICGKPLTKVWFAFAELERRAGELVGQRIVRIETRGKALLSHFSGGLTLYSHNQLYGVWRVAAPGSAPDTKRSLRVRLECADNAILLYSASDIELLDAGQLATQPFLQRIGPDVLNYQLSVEEVRARLLSPRFRGRALGSLLLDQSFLAGLGNYLRAEILWEARLRPTQRACELSEAELDSLASACLTIARLSYETRGQVDENRHHGALFSFQVFHREGQACPRCGHLIARGMSNSRPFYWCPECQKLSP